MTKGDIISIDNLGMRLSSPHACVENVYLNSTIRWYAVILLC